MNSLSMQRVQGGFNGESYLKVMDWVAQKAALTLEQTGRLTVVVQDNSSIHTRQLVQQQWERWQQQGKFLVFLAALLFRDESD